MTMTEARPADATAAAADGPDASDPAALAARVDAALAAVDAAGPDTRVVAGELRDALAALTTAALTTIVRRLRADDRGRDLLYELVEAPEVYTLLAQHGILRAPLVVRVQRVLDHVRPYLHGHGGDVELVSVVEGVVTIRLSGACSGCGSAGATVRDEIADVLLEAIPEVQEVRTVDEQPGPSADWFLPVGDLTVRRSVAR